MGKTVVIGHGPSLRGAGLGEKIDSFDCVVRIAKTGSWQGELDYGSRVSWYCGTTACYVNYWDKLKTPEFGYFVWQKHKGLGIAHKIGERLLNSGFFVKNISKTVWLWQDLMVDPVCEYFSNGFTAILAAAIEVGNPITAVGFDNLSRGENDPKKYIGSSDYENRETSPNFHDYSQERLLIDRISEDYVPVRFGGLK